MKFKPTFLLVEDNLIDQIVIKQLLKKNFDIIEINITNNGMEAIQWLNNNQNLNQSVVILTDIQMPIMNGFEFLNAYEGLSEQFKKTIQIYVLSSTLDLDEIKRIKENNYVDGFLNKPLQIEEFKNQLNT